MKKTLVEDNFKWWLENGYISDKIQDHLTHGSAINYVNGIKSLNRKLRLTGSGIFDVEDIEELNSLSVKVENVIEWRKDEQSHFEAYKKFRLNAVNFSNKRVGNKIFRQADVHKRQLVEISAINVTDEYFTTHGYSVISVERDNVGWDLEASKEHETLFLEVKGLSGPTLAIELSPNEYRESINKINYRLCVVTCTLSDPKLYIFQFDKEIKKWKTELDKVLAIEEVKGARLRLE
jgi:hypothetical protein